MAIIQNTIRKAGGKFVTADATPVVVAQYTMPGNGQAIFIDAKVVAINQDGTQAASYWLQGLFLQDLAGTVTQVGSTRVIATANESNAAWDCTLGVSGAVVGITATGAAATNINWRVDWNDVGCSVVTPA